MFLCYENSKIAAGIVYLVNKMFNREEWSENLVEDTKMDITDLRGVAKELYLMLHKNEAGFLTAVRRKF